MDLMWSPWMECRIIPVGFEKEIEFGYHNRRKKDVDISNSSSTDKVNVYGSG